MLILMGVLLMGNLLTDTTSFKSFLSHHTAIPFFHHSTRERVSCNKWLNQHKQHSNILYLFGTVALLENEAVHLKLRFLNERLNNTDIANETEDVKLTNTHPHNNFITQLHSLISDMRQLDQDLDRFFIPRLKMAEVAEEDGGGIYTEPLKSLIYHSFELRCKLNYWIRRKTNWLQQHQDDDNMKIENLDDDDDDDDEDDHTDDYYDLLVTLEENRNDYKNVGMSKNDRLKRDYITVHNLTIQLHWFINKGYMSKLFENLYARKSEDRGVHKRDYGGSGRVRDKVWSDSAKTLEEWGEGRKREERVSGERGGGDLYNGDLSLLRRNILSRRRSRFRNRRI